MIFCVFSFNAGRVAARFGCSDGRLWSVFVECGKLGDAGVL